jgi:prophage tail gpP-like protein
MAWQQLGELVRRAEASAETEPVESLRLLLAAEALCASLADQAVTKARNQGVTWEDIAEASGQSRQAAWRRWRNRISNT